MSRPRSRKRLERKAVLETMSEIDTRLVGCSGGEEASGLSYQDPESHPLFSESWAQIEVRWAFLLQIDS